MRTLVGQCRWGEICPIGSRSPPTRRRGSGLTRGVFAHRGSAHQRVTIAPPRPPARRRLRGTPSCRQRGGPAPRGPAASRSSAARGGPQVRLGAGARGYHRRRHTAWSRITWCAPRDPSPTEPPRQHLVVARLHLRVRSRWIHADKGPILSSPVNELSTALEGKKLSGNSPGAPLTEPVPPRSTARRPPAPSEA